jgi:hypothetical protein
VWVALEGIVYDLSEYEHPGGEKDLLKVAGTDAGAAYTGAGEKNHPVPLSEVMFEEGIVRVGVLVADPEPTMSPSDVASMAPSVSPSTLAPTTSFPSSSPSIVRAFLGTK